MGLKLSFSTSSAAEKKDVISYTLVYLITCSASLPEQDVFDPKAISPSFRADPVKLMYILHFREIYCNDLMTGGRELLLQY